MTPGARSLLDRASNTHQMFPPIPEPFSHPQEPRNDSHSLGWLTCSPPMAVSREPCELSQASATPPSQTGKQRKNRSWVVLCFSLFFLQLVVGIEARAGLSSLGG